MSSARTTSSDNHVCICVSLNYTYTTNDHSNNLLLLYHLKDWYLGNFTSIWTQVITKLERVGYLLRSIQELQLVQKPYALGPETNTCAAFLDNTPVTLNDDEVDASGREAV